MAIDAIEWAFRQDVAVPSAKLVLLALADHAGKDGKCWPSIERLTERTGLARSSVFRILPVLAQMGLITYNQKQGSSNRYRLNLDMELRAPKKELFKKEPIPAGLRKQVFERDAYRCCHCGGWDDLHCDHIIPESKGGEATLDNLQALCGSCNRSKGASHFETVQGSDPSDADAEKSHADAEKSQHKTLTVKNHKEPTPSGRARACALPAGWRPDEELVAWVTERFPSLDWENSHEIFTDYWLGCGKPKLDWRATWRNWMRRDAEQPNPFGSARATRMDGVVRTNAERVERALARRERGAAGAPADGPRLRLIEGGG